MLIGAERTTSAPRTIEVIVGGFKVARTSLEDPTYLRFRPLSDLTRRSETCIVPISGREDIELVVQFRVCGSRAILWSRRLVSNVYVHFLKGIMCTSRSSLLTQPFTVLPNPLSTDINAVIHDFRLFSSFISFILFFSQSIHSSKRNGSIETDITMK